jgi:hypothetical protein
MTTETDYPAYWLERAKEAREVTKQIPDEEMRDILEEIARRYERVADQVRRGSNEATVN